MTTGREGTESPGLKDIAEELRRQTQTLACLLAKRSTLTVTKTELGVLAAVYERPQRVTTLAAAEGVTQPAITQLVNRLESRHWVRRRCDPTDRRAVLVAATTAGRAAFDSSRAEHKRLLDPETAALAAGDLETLARAVDILDQLVARLKERRR
jgi:DNA-binding MarR family transcriptional regulator